MEISFGGGGGFKEEFDWDAPFREGWQVCEILFAAEHCSQKGNMCIKLILGLPEHENARRKTSYYVSANDAGGRLTNLFEAVGLTEIIQGGGGSFEPGDLKGRTVLARISAREGYSGQTRDAKVEWLQADDTSKVEGSSAPAPAIEAEEIPF